MTHYNGKQFDVVDEYSKSGIQVVGLAFPNGGQGSMEGGWETTPANNSMPVRAAACRPATAIRYFFDHLHEGDRSRAFGVFGHSGGSAALSFSLSHYGVGSFVDYAQISAGPVFARMDLGCVSDTPKKRLPDQCRGQPETGSATTYGPRYLCLLTETIL